MNSRTSPLKDITIYGQTDWSLRNTVQFLRNNGVNVTVRTEQPPSMNTTTTKGKEKVGDKGKQQAMPTPMNNRTRKGKEKIVDNGKENYNPSVPRRPGGIVINEPSSDGNQNNGGGKTKEISKQTTGKGKRKATHDHDDGNQSYTSKRSMGQRRRHQREAAKAREDTEMVEAYEDPHHSTTTEIQQDFPIAYDEDVNEQTPNPEMVIEQPRVITTERHYLGRMNVPCRYCLALHWIDEKLSESSIRNPLFGKCCLQGQVRLPLLLTPPQPIQDLYDGNDSQSRSFLSYIREYNAANAFTSLGTTMEPRTLSGRGPQSFIIHGELRHRTGALLPDDEREATYAQLYIYDPASALDIRNRRNPRLDTGVLKIIQDILLMNNVFYPIYCQAYEILQQANSEIDHNLPVYLHYSQRTDRRRYNLPSVEEIAVILPGDGTESSATRDIVIHFRSDNALMRINECHPAYLPLHYVLLFPYGELGWEPEIYQVRPPGKRPQRVTQMQYYSYRIFERRTEYSTILRARKLFQEFIVDAWAATEQNRLFWVRTNQTKIRCELYQGLSDIDADGLGPDQIGQRYILPSSFTGGPRFMYEIYQDSMAITRYHKHPDIFLTMTANPNWPEVIDELLPHQTPNDRPELIARVFELKRKRLMKEINDNGVFGRAVAHVYTIEFQKRGLPHMHALIFLHHDDKIRNSEQVDSFVSAEFPDPDIDPALFQTIKRCMVHGPCGTRNPNASCMENDKCIRSYPRNYTDMTTMDKNGYPIYRRRDKGELYRVNNYEVNNGDVVPHNPFLCRMFDCHINVEVCAGLRCVKYIHKYIYKGHDRTTMVLGGMNEIQQYIDARYIGPPEAAWRIFGYNLHEEKPNVVRLQLHLPGMHNVTFNETDSRSRVRQKAQDSKSTLMAFLDCCKADPLARAYTYQEFPAYYTWLENEKMWKRRDKKSEVIGRMYFASPTAGERFYLRLLLIVVKGPKSWADLRTFNRVEYDTFKLACVARGLLEDDGEWVVCLEEASIMSTGYQLRRLFSTILSECAPLQPDVLWNRFSMNICDDLAHKICLNFGIPNPKEDEVKDYGLYLLNQCLEESGKCLAEYPPMPQPIKDWNVIPGNRLIWEHRQLEHEAQASSALDNVSRLNDDQRHAFNVVTDSVLGDKGIVFFLNGGAGTGKTFLYNTIASNCRRLGHIVITVASSGIASLLLIGGRTAHSTFRIPIDVLQNSMCGFKKQSMHAELFREVKLIIWDEVPMQHRHCVEAVERTLRDIRDDNRPFGGITVVLGGDFKQILPVICKGVREQIVCASLIRSPLWRGMQVLTLSLNMRLNNGGCGNADFIEFLAKVGTMTDVVVELPTMIRRCGNVRELIFAIYPRIDVSGTMTPNFLTERTILSARNDDVFSMNAEALNLFPGETITYLAADKMALEDANDNRYPNEYLNSLEPSGLPPFRLELKVGCPVMLLRNLAPKDGLCNGTRLMIVRCGERVLQAKILTGDKAGEKVLIPRISLTPTGMDMPIQMTRRQFPIRLAFAMTINKSQGQSVKFVGIDLRTPVFTHGQLYVALSRCTASSRISVLLPDAETNTTTNIVYPEVWEKAIIEIHRRNRRYEGLKWGTTYNMVAIRNSKSHFLVHIDTFTLWKVVRKMFP